MLPERSFEIVTELAPTDVHDRLANHVGPRLSWTAVRAKTDRPYWGRVLLASFELTPNVDYRNRFVPCALGRVAPKGSGSHVSVRMRMLPFTRIVVTVWLAAVSLFFVAAIAAVVRDGVLHGFTWPHLIPVVFASVFPAFAVFAPRRGFRKEARPLEEFLRHTLDPR